MATYEGTCHRQLSMAFLLVLILSLWNGGEIPLLGCPLGPSFSWANEEVNPENIHIGTASTSFSGVITIGDTFVTESGAAYLTTLHNSFQGFAGINQINQAAGSSNSQGNWLGVAVVQEGGEPGISLYYKSELRNNMLKSSGSRYEVSITGSSFAGGSGITMINQSAGNMNIQFNALALNIGSANVTKLSDIELSSVNVKNQIINNSASPNSHYALLDMENGAFNNYHGFWSANQVAGNLSQVTTVFHVNIHTIP
ncbi:MAG: hypothetical protein QXT73_08265 [Candidatus Methanomethylicaceae archaeon]